MSLCRTISSLNLAQYCMIILPRVCQVLSPRPGFNHDITCLNEETLTSRQIFF